MTSTDPDGGTAARYRRLVTRRGKKCALVAVGHSILTAIWLVLTNGGNHLDLGTDNYLKRLDPARQARRLADQLHQLGYEAVVTPTQGRIA